MAWRGRARIIEVVWETLATAKVSRYGYSQDRTTIAPDNRPSLT